MATIYYLYLNIPHLTIVRWGHEIGSYFLKTLEINKGEKVKKHIAFLGIVLIAVVICSGCKQEKAFSPTESTTEESLEISAVEAKEADKFLEKISKNKNYVQIRNMIVSAGFNEIEAKGTDDLVYSFADQDNDAEGIVGFMTFISNKKGDTRSPEANIMVNQVSYTDSNGIAQDTTIIIPFAYYFNERPQGVNYELFSANETDTVWISQVCTYKALNWRKWGKCVAGSFTPVCAVAISACASTTIGYFACVAACCGGSAIGAGIGCAIFNNRLE